MARPEEQMVVRNWGSGKNHVAELSPDLEVTAHFVDDFQAFRSPVSTVCRTILSRFPIVKMLDAPVDCIQCRRITGMTGVGPRWGPGGSKL